MRRFSLLLVFLLLVPFLAGAQNAGLEDELIYRINFGRADDVKTLLEKGANPNTKSDQGDPAVALAVGRNDPEAVKMVLLLLDKGANPNVTDKAGNIPLMVAARNGQAEMVTALIAKGADYHISSSTGVSLLDVARNSGNPATAKPIEEAMAQEKAYDEGLHTSDRFRSLIRRYAFQSCSYQYWTYFLGSEQDPKSDDKTQDHIDASRTELAHIVSEIQKYYPYTQGVDLQRLSGEISKKIVDNLDSLISNRNRASHGVGTGKDVEKRCGDLADEAHVRYMK